MCGIVGYIGKKDIALKVLTDGLSALEYRGYDSAGVAYKFDNNVKIIKSLGKIENLKNELNNGEESNLGIGHTRWATHGKPSTTNSHPHNVNKITIVHNGIIENYEEIKNELKQQGYNFKSETDTEVACAYIDYIYSKTKNMLETIKKCEEKFIGSYAFGIINEDELDRLYACRKDSPLIIAKKDDSFFIASDVPAILKYTNNYYLLDNYDIAVLKDGVSFYDKELNKIDKELNTFEGDLEAAEKGGYEHFMLKEIHEIDKVIKNTTYPYIENGISTLLEKTPDLSKYSKIDIVACGSAYHTGMVGKYLIENYANIPVNVEVASEYRYEKHFFDKKTLIIFVSQSGETADTLACLRIAKEHGIDTLAIVNVVGSSIAREADKVIYIKAGPEIAVATTKAYSAQLSVFSLLALSLGIRNANINVEQANKLTKKIKELPKLINECLKSEYNNIANKIFLKEDIYFIGRGIDYAIALEGSLKLKEISYIHSEAYAAGELKHGSIALIDKDTPVIAIVTDKNIAEKTISNIKEVKARGAYVILVITEELNDNFDFDDEKIVVPNSSNLIQAILTILPLQLLSYSVAKLRDCDIDKPKNLAKSVTVE